MTIAQPNFSPCPVLLPLPFHKYCFSKTHPSNPPVCTSLRRKVCLRVPEPCYTTPLGFSQGAGTWRRGWGQGKGLPTIMWLQTSQKVGFLKMCSWKAWALPLAGCRPALVGVDVRLPGAGSGLESGLTSASRSPGSFTSLLVRWKKLSALLLRRLLVLKESDRFSFWSCNAMTEQTLLRSVVQTLAVWVRSAPCTARFPLTPLAPRRLISVPVWVG